jgi:hypothetical protein
MKNIGVDGIPEFCTNFKKKIKDGSQHRHVFLKLTKKVNLKDQRALDLSGHHPNIQGARSAEAVKIYCTKVELVIPIYILSR